MGVPPPRLGLLHVSLAIAICLAHASSVVERWCYTGGLATTHWAQHSVAMLEQRDQYMKAEVWDFPVMAEQTKLIISYLLYGFFIMDPSLRSIKTNNWSASPKRLPHSLLLHLNEFYTWARVTVRWHWSGDTVFDSCQSTVTWMSIRMSTICLEHPASNPGHYKIDDSQSKRGYYCSHII